MKTMIAGRFHLDTKQLRVEEVPVPEPGPGEVLLEVKAAGGDLLPGARKRALDFGADLAIDAAAPDIVMMVRDATGGRGLDVAVDCAGVPSVREQASAVLAPKGALVLVGITPKPITITEGLTFNYLSKRVLGHYGSSPEHIDELVRLVAGGRLDLAPSISAQIPLAEAAAAVHQLERKVGDPIRLVLVP